jgi:hypothetical protein
MTKTGHTVVVLGAGASVAEAKGFRPKRDKDYPPLDRDFFARAERHTEAERLEPILDRAKELGQKDLCSTALPVSLETYLGRLFFEMNARSSDRNVQTYFDLVQLYAAELLTTTNWMIGRSGSLRRLLTREQRAADKLTIVTFNHDLLIENALTIMSEKVGGHPWCLRHGYGFKAMPIVIQNSEDEQFLIDCEESATSHVRVLKLHGSVNWVFRTLRDYPSADFARRKRSLIIWSNQELTPWANRSRWRGSAKRKTWRFWPLIVPPIYEKHGFIHGELRRVWDEATTAVADATKIVFWGYSFPNADLHARYFFQSAANKNEALRSPIVINPDPQSETNLWEVLRPKHVAHFHDIVDYLADGG